MDGVTQSKHYAPFSLSRPAFCYKWWKTTASLSNQSEQTYYFLNHSGATHANQDAANTRFPYGFNIFLFVVIGSWLADIICFTIQRLLLHSCCETLNGASDGILAKASPSLLPSSPHSAPTSPLILTPSPLIPNRRDILYFHYSCLPLMVN